MWRSTSPQDTVEKLALSVPEQNREDSIFKVKYDNTQKQLQSIAAMDDLVSGIITQRCD